MKRAKEYLKKKNLVYSILAIDYQASLIEKEIDEITAILEEKKYYQSCDF